MRDTASIYSTGPCRKCRGRKNLIRGLCYPCRRPEDRRQICRAGVGWGSADALANIVRKARRQGRSGRKIKDILTFVHPRLMENITVRNDGTMVPTDLGYVWMRRNGWVKKSVRKE